MQSDMPDLSGLKSGSNANASAGNGADHRNTVILVYALQAASFLVGFTIFAAIIINYIKKEDVAGTVAESHFRWQIRTFWFGLLWLGIAFITYILLIGYLLLIVVTLWFIYRIAKGWLRISDNKPMYS